MLLEHVETREDIEEYLSGYSDDLIHPFRLKIVHHSDRVRPSFC